MCPDTRPGFMSHWGTVAAECCGLATALPYPAPPSSFCPSSGSDSMCTSTEPHYLVSLCEPQRCLEKQI